METRTGNDVGACFMAVVLIKGSVPGVKGYLGILALSCCHVATVKPTRELSDMLPADVGPHRRKQLALAVCSAMSYLSSPGRLRAACSGCGGHWSAWLISMGRGHQPHEKLALSMCV